MQEQNGIVKLESNHLKSGIGAGLIAGIVFGSLLGMMGMLPMVAKLIGASSSFAGFILNLVFSAIIGLIFGYLFGHAAALKRTAAINLGLAYGFIWWILGPLLIMPIWLGMGPQLTLEAASGAIGSLWGHLLFGFILGLVYSLMTTPKSDHGK